MTPVEKFFVDLAYENLEKSLQNNTHWDKCRIIKVKIDTAQKEKICEDKIEKWTKRLEEEYEKAREFDKHRAFCNEIFYEIRHSYRVYPYYEDSRWAEYKKHFY